ncbi:MAG: DnaA regulatory inactivator Hda [Halioglobus sp.]|nr:DnaA regulatory inactivator Hda [Halioglobus sp.]
MAEVDPPRGAAGHALQHQLALEVRLRDDATLDNFLAFPKIQPLVAALQAQLEPAGEPVIYLYGPAGTGKSHLLQASCYETGAETLYLPLSDLRQYAAGDVFQGAEHADRVCIDDIHAVLGDVSWEQALFNFYNDARQYGCRLVVAGEAAPRALAVNLEDLRSRLSWGIVYQLAQPQDHDKEAILQFRARRRGLSLPPSVASYIVSRAPRAMSQLLQALETLDKASLAEKRALSIPFVKEVLGW